MSVIGWFMKTKELPYIRWRERICWASHCSWQIRQTDLSGWHWNKEKAEGEMTYSICLKENQSEYENISARTFLLHKCNHFLYKSPVNLLSKIHLQYIPPGHQYRQEADYQIQCKHCRKRHP